MFFQQFEKRVQTIARRRHSARGSLFIMKFPLFRRNKTKKPPSYIEYQNNQADTSKNYIVRGYVSGRYNDDDTVKLDTKGFKKQRVSFMKKRKTRLRRENLADLNESSFRCGTAIDVGYK